MPNKKEDISILIIYTGGTIGMIKDQDTGVLSPFDFARIEKQVPELKCFGYRLDSYEFRPPIDSSNMNPAIWVKIADVIEQNYAKYNGFVILHGTDTMAYSASAVSFMLENLSKPVIFTGSQLPLGILRTDGKENLISSIEIAAAHHDGYPLVPEVCIYFEYKLYRGNRTTKLSTDQFQAFSSENYPLLAESGIEIKYNFSSIMKPNEKGLSVHKSFSNDIALVKLYPGISREYLSSVLQTKGLRAVVIESYGNGNAPGDEWFIKMIDNSIKSGIIVLNVTQCISGNVEMKRYETGMHLHDIGVISGRDMTTEAAITKLMYLLGNYTVEKVKSELKRSICGEISIE